MKRALPLALALLLLVTGCAPGLPVERAPTDLPLPTVQPRYEAPSGDSQAGRVTPVVLYLPDASATRLTSKVSNISVAPGQALEEAMVRAVLEEVNAAGYAAQPLQLAQSSSPVEATGELVTVNLNRYAFAPTLPTEKLFALQVAITNTLTELPGIRYVNVLVEGGDMGFAYNTLPTGVFASYPSGDISTFWGQIEAQRESVGLTKAASLFFLSESGQLLLGEVRDTVFSERSITTYTSVLLSELAKGPQRTDGAQGVVPDAAYFDRDPVFDESERMLYLYFLPEMDDWLRVRGFTRGMLFASVCCTLCGFLPALQGVRVYVGEELVTQMELMDGSVLVRPDGTWAREHFSFLVGDPTIVYFPLADGSGLSPVLRPLEQRYRTQARALLRELMRPPQDARFSAALPEGVGDADIIGLQIIEDTALINLTPAFAQACAGMDAARERDMVYAMVNTLTELEGVRRVRFYVDGTQRQLADTLFIGGEFLRHTGLIAP